MFILASKSPRRVELLNQIGASFRVVASDIYEITNHDSHDLLVKENAKLKAIDIFERNRKYPVLGADTLVVFRGNVLGKPTDDNDAINMLSMLSGHSHLVYTGIAWVFDGRVVTDCSITEVTMLPLTECEIRHYVSSGEPLDKAGSYAIQGKAGAYISKISGSFSNVVGLPLHLVVKLSKELGIDLYDNNG